VTKKQHRHKTINNFKAPGMAPILFALAGLFFLSNVLHAARIIGTVQDQKKNRLPAVEVIVKETGASTLTNEDGKFFVIVPDHLKNAVLIFKRKGYHPRENRVQVDEKPKLFKLFFIPGKQLLQEVTVTATNIEKKEIAVPMAESSVTDLEIQEKMPINIIDTLSDTPGVHYIGSGGFSITPTVRGLARRRVLVLVDGARVTSDRRAGTSASFVPPEMAQKIEVVRSSSSVLYGSDAIGGVVNIFTRPNTSGFNRIDDEKNALNLNLNSAGKRSNAGINLTKKIGNWQFNSGFQYTNSENYSAPGQEIYHSGFSYYSGLLDISFKNKNRAFYLGYIGGIGKDIGKPNRDNNPNKYTVVPEETDHFIRLGLSEKSLLKNATLDFSLFFNPTTYHLEKIDNAKQSLQKSDTEAQNFGFKSTLKKSPGKTLSYQAGFEWFTRQNVKMDNLLQSPDQLDFSTPLDNGTRNDLGFFLTFDYSGLNALKMNINGGIRYTHFSIKAEADNTHVEKSTGAPSFFLGITKKLNRSISLFATIGRAYRFPSLGESFYTGLTGRKYVIGNPNLKAESSFNFDTGLKMVAGKVSMGIYLFSYNINHMIERYKNDEGIYTYDNIDRGKIKGGEIELQFSPITHMNLYGHFFYYHGRSTTTDDPLNDIPAPRLMLGSKYFLNRLWIEINYLHSFKKTDPGPAEDNNNAYNVLNLKSGVYLSSSFYIYLKLSNILNEKYYPNPDPDIPYAHRFNASAGLHFYF
jgi:outer membrane receptor protein involved in Fe transport